MDTNTVLTVLNTGLNFVKAHWDQLAFLGGLVLMATQGKAQSYMLTQAVEVVGNIAKEELSNPEKKAKAIEALQKVVPVWAKPFVNATTLDLTIEKAWQLVVKPQLPVVPAPVAPVPTPPVAPPANQ